MRVARTIGRILLCLLGLALISLLVALWVYRDIPAAELEARYTTPASRFLNVDGVRIHYRDEGPQDAPVIVLIHANFGSLINWDPWADALKDRFRVVRFDMTGHGLTGPDPGGDYSAARTVALMEKFVDAIGLRHFSLAGISIGGSIAIRYAGAHPERVDRLILINAGIIEGQVMKRAGMRVPAAANILKYITPRALAAYMLHSRAGNPDSITEKHIDEWYDMWMREGQRAAILERLRTYSDGDVAGTVEKVTAPVLIEWGAANRQTPPEQAEELRRLLKNAASVQVILYPGIGHFALQEAGEATARDARAFLEGRPAEAPAGAGARPAS